MTGPGGQSARGGKSGDNYYASRDGNVYKNTGNGWQHYDSGGWNNVQAPSQNFQARAASPAGGRSALGRGVLGLEELGRRLQSGSGGGSGGSNQSSVGGWDRGGGYGGGGRSWGGGGFGGFRR